jgi:hypothetical protein
MSPSAIFGTQLVLAYVPWLLFLGAFVWPRLKSMDHVQAQRAIASLHSFRFFGLVFILPGVVGPDLPTGFAISAAHGDFVTGILAMLALMTVRLRPLFWLFVVAFNMAGAADLLLNYYHGAEFGLPERAGDLAAAYWIPILYVPALMITHVLAFYLLVRQLLAARASAGTAAPRSGTA